METYAIATKDSVRKGNVSRTLSELKDSAQWVPCFLGNGYSGACFDPLGSMCFSSATRRPTLLAEPLLHSLYHHVHGNFGMDYSAPIGRLLINYGGLTYDNIDLDRTTQYRQELDIFEGLLRTQVQMDESLAFEQEQFFSQVCKNLFCVRLRNTGESEQPLTVRFDPVLNRDLDLEQTLRAEVALQQSDSCLRWRLDTGSVTTWISLLIESAAGSEVQRETQQISCSLAPGGECCIWMVLTSDLETENPIDLIQQVHELEIACGFDSLREEHSEWWARFWEESILSLPANAQDLHKIWMRSNYYLASNFSDVSVPHPPLSFGLAATEMPSYSPQDVLLSYQNLLSANHVRHACSAACVWSDTLPHAERYSQQLFRIGGACYPWIAPMFDWSDYHCAGVPNKLYYQHHSQGLIARLLYDLFRFTAEEDFLQQHAYPVIKELAQFYRGILTVDLRSEQYEMRFTPSQSQDEYAPPHQRNYFDALLAAHYTIQTAHECAQILDLDKPMRLDWLQVLAAGFAYPKLAQGDHYLIYEGDPRSKCGQQYPVQLNPIYLLPVRELFDDPRILNAYQNRYQVCSISQTSRIESFCLGSFLLSSCRLGNMSGFLTDFNQMWQRGILDPDLIQTFESSQEKPYFMPTQGLLMESITECFVQWWKGFLELLPNISPDWVAASENDPIVFRNLRTPGAFLISGLIHGSREEIQIACEKGGSLRFGIPSQWRQGILSDGKQNYLCSASGGDILSLQTHPGTIYRLRSDSSGKSGV